MWRRKGVRPLRGVRVGFEDERVLARGSPNRPIGFHACAKAASTKASRALCEAPRIVQSFFTHAPRQRLQRRAASRAKLPRIVQSFFTRAPSWRQQRRAAPCATLPESPNCFFGSAPTPQLQITNKTPTQANNPHAKIAPRSNGHVSLNE